MTLEPMPRSVGPLHTPGQPLPGSVAASIEELAPIGRDGGRGITRIAWTPQLFEAYERVGAWMRGLGLDVEIDPAGNLIGRWQVGSGSAVLVGSHLDTVPSGGAFDGPLGVVAALHAVERLKRDRVQPRRPLWVIAFMDEEGTRFGTSLFGSRAFAGAFAEDELNELGARTDEAGVSLREAMRLAGFDLNRLHEAVRIDDVCAYLELHIEQGPVLETEKARVGVVTSILGLRGYRVRLRGEARHLATPFELRRDALAGAARVILALREQVHAHQGATVNVGRLDVSPGGSNIVPGLAEFTIDLRATTEPDLARLAELAFRIVHGIATEESLEVELEQTYALAPLDFDPALTQLLGRAAKASGAEPKYLRSRGGHDAMVIGRHVPAAMLFAPSRRGISHAPEEFTEAGDVAHATEVLTAALRERLEEVSLEPLPS